MFSSLPLIDESLRPSSPSFCHYVQFITSEGQNPELGGFSISHVQSITSEPTDSQVSPFCLLLCLVNHL